MNKVGVNLLLLLSSNGIDHELGLVALIVLTQELVQWLESLLLS